MTPNQDGVNDELVLQSDCIFESLDVTVYDRWGHLVYTATQLPATWDGTLRGKPVPEGVYYLALHGLARSSGGEIKRVHAARPLTLLR
jgi:gliding motility-associated-like protein